MLRTATLLALTRAARPPMKLRRRAALSLLTPMPANAMWQLWLPSDMERFVAEADATADSVLAQMDKCAETSWMMNMGSDKGILIEKVIAQRRPKRLLEIGTFLGYMSIRLARSMPEDASLTTIEIDEDNYAASRRIRAKALGKRDDSVVALKANASQAIQALKGPFDFVLMDHWKPVLTQRLFPNFSELQVRVDGVGATLRHRDAVDVALRESTGLVRESRRFATLSFDTGLCEGPRGVTKKGFIGGQMFSRGGQRPLPRRSRATRLPERAVRPSNGRRERPGVFTGCCGCGCEVPEARRERLEGY